MTNNAIKLPELNTKKLVSKLIGEYSNGMTEFHYTLMTIKQEKQIAYARETSKNPNDVFKSVISVLQDCVEENIKDFYIIDFLQLFLKIRATSNGSEVALKVKCPYCETKNKVILSLSEDLNENNKNNFKTIIKLNDDVSVSFRQHKLRDLLSCKTLDFTNINSNSLYPLLLYCVEKIDFKDETYYSQYNYPDEIGFSLDQIDKWLDTIPGTNEITNFFDDIPIIEIDKNFDCENCGKDVRLDGGVFSNFL
jgi:hypothetical protein